MARAYAHRPPYGEETFATLLGLLAGDTPARVLDVGCGTGDIARPLASRVEHVDAIDASDAMIAAGRGQPGGKAANLLWTAAPMETALLEGPYALAVAGESIHWMNWSVVFPRLTAVLAEGAVLAIVGRAEAPLPWTDELIAIIRRYSTNQDYVPFDLVPGLHERGWFEPLDTVRTTTETFVQSREDYIESIHSRNGFSRARMGASAAVFDAMVRDLLMRHGIDDDVRLETWSVVSWGQL